jgi:hypothetical protein
MGRNRAPSTSGRNGALPRDTTAHHPNLVRASALERRTASSRCRDVPPSRRRPRVRHSPTSSPRSLDTPRTAGRPIVCEDTRGSPALWNASRNVSRLAPSHCARMPCASEPRAVAWHRRTGSGVPQSREYASACAGAARPARRPVWRGLGACAMPGASPSGRPVAPHTAADA